MSTSTPTTYIFNEYEVPYEYDFTKLSAITQPLETSIENDVPKENSSSEFKVIDAILRKIWNLSGYSACNNLKNEGEYYTASFQVVEGVKPESEGEGVPPTNILFGYAVHATGAVGSVKKSTKRQAGRKGTQDSASGKYNEAYIIVYVIDNDNKAICKVWKVVDDAVNDMIFTYQNVGVKYVRDGLDGSKTLLGWDSEVVDGKTKYYFYLPKMSALLEGMHKPIIANADSTKFTAAQIPYVITYSKA